jgi:hypothetical protein
MIIPERIGKRIEAIQKFIDAVKNPHKIITRLSIVQTEGGEKVPKFYAVGYFDPMRSAVHWYIFPLHYIVRAYRWTDHRWNSYRHQLSKIDLILIDAYHAGIKEGRQLERRAHAMELMRQSILRDERQILALQNLRKLVKKMEKAQHAKRTRKSTGKKAKRRGDRKRTRAHGNRKASSSRLRA